MCDKDKDVNFAVTFVQGPAKLKVVERCNGFTVKNRGNTNLIINDEPLDPGESKGFLCWPQEVYKGRITISFRPIVGVPPPLRNSGFVTQKFYIDKK